MMEWKSMGLGWHPIYEMENIKHVPKNVPNHQPEDNLIWAYSWSFMQYIKKGRETQQSRNISGSSYPCHINVTWADLVTPISFGQKKPYKNTQRNINTLYILTYTLWWTNSLQWKDPPFLMGKSTISMAIFNCKLLVHQRVYPQL